MQVKRILLHCGSPNWEASKKKCIWYRKVSFRTITLNHTNTNYNKTAKCALSGIEHLLCSVIQSYRIRFCPFHESVASKKLKAGISAIGDINMKLYNIQALHACSAAAAGS